MGGEREEKGAATAMAASREKSTFAVTCSLLSQYLKGNKAGLHGLAMVPAPPAAAAGVFRPPTTMNLLSALDAPAEETNEAAKATTKARPSDSVGLSLEKASREPHVLAATDEHKGENPREAAGEKAQQLTIIYGGKVVLFDKFPSTKVNDLLQVVNSGGAADKAGASDNAAPQNLPKPSHNLSDLPIARRNSLHKFLEKRKDRITAKAPYQVNSSVEVSKQATGELSWLGLGQEATIKQQDI